MLEEQNPVSFVTCTVNLRVLYTVLSVLSRKLQANPCFTGICLMDTLPYNCPTYQSLISQVMQTIQ